ncbi:M20/M25/M40 family metallo-hydrolase [Levilactobacillus acidifarinae]|uniref:Acetylornithine deacetylase succinyl-diaminopimelate desuccinylase-like protein n=1 Tax=Levilactobacillus acidifarinae DSM 19394 = JCM 15949 TaxID=1423715 RepID=A0A0R1LMW1_9LACO|nr:M20/M25/M40 family metallo-hydrolase [Levilactobacillus acidifarinae]KRK94899.1 acetylornithine deacetylase succinyl-diaminopimelate desuccinylase-like protein [Levilactobacillus acidifarinae DSM 19394]GEO70300.1 acetylornithine deacetylase [Levilactobacillus acidifarinae]
MSDLTTAVTAALTADHDRLAAYLKLQTVSVQNRGITATVTFLTHAFEELGAQVQVWRDVAGSNPFVFATFTAGPHGNADRTLLFYNHYDVQPPEPLAEWQTDPFTLTEKAGYYYARGISDDKGELMLRLSAVKALQASGGLPCNLKFVVEGEEEIGSRHIPQMTQQHASDLAADAIVWETGGKDADENFQVTCGAKGILCLELSVTTAEKDLHSSLAAYADNAAWRLTQALASLRTADNRVKVAGFYDDIRPLTPTERRAVAAMTLNGDVVKQHFGLKRPLITADPVTELVNGSTMTLNGLSSGYEGAGVKTVIPKRATAKVDCRLVPGQDPQHQAQLIRDQLKRNGFGDVRVTYLLGEAPFRSDLTAPFVKMAVKTAHQVYGDHVRLVPNMAGTGPQAPFFAAVQAPIVAVGSTWAGSGPHAPNENVRVADYQQAACYTAELLTVFGTQM